MSKKNSKEPEDIYTVDQIMDTLNVTRRTVHNWIKNKKLRAVRIGKVWRIPKHCYEEFLEKNMNSSEIRR